MKQQLSIDNEQDLANLLGLLHDIEVLVPDITSEEMKGERYSELVTFVVDLLEEEGTLELTIGEIALIAYQIALKFDLEVTPKLVKYLSEEEVVQ